MVGLLAGNDWQIVAGGGCWQWLLVVAGSGGPVVAMECGEGKRKEKGREKKKKKKKMKEDGEPVTMRVFGKWQCRGKDCGKEKKNGRENGDRRV